MDSWPVPPEYSPDLNEIKRDYRAMPLCVFRNGKPVNVCDIKKTIAGALIEVQFELRHFAIHNKEFDSFNATLQQLQVIEPGRECPATIFKRKDFCDGPIEGRPSRGVSTHKKPRLPDVPAVGTTALSYETVQSPTGNKNDEDNDDSLEIEERILHSGLFPFLRAEWYTVTNYSWQPFLQQREKKKDARLHPLIHPTSSHHRSTIKFFET